MVAQFYLKMDSIRPAVDFPKEFREKMSAEEFRQKLLAWFNEKGLLSDLRARLRIQMIEILKDTALGSSTVLGGNRQQEFSPESEATNMLIGEFMLRQGYHYALSVFSAEAPLKSLPNFDDGRWYFLEGNVRYILDILGLSEGREVAKSVVNLYGGRSCNFSLLTCILKVFSEKIAADNKRDLSEDSEDNRGSLETFARYKENLIRMLRRNKTDPKLIREICAVVHGIVTAELEHLVRYYEEQLKSLELHHKETAARKEHELREALHAQQLAHETERKQMCDYYDQKKAELDEMAASLRKSAEGLEEQSGRLRKLEEALNKREMAIELREKEIRDLQIENRAAAGSGAVLQHLSVENDRFKTLQKHHHRNMSELFKKISAFHQQLEEAEARAFKKRFPAVDDEGSWSIFLAQLDESVEISRKSSTCDLLKDVRGHLGALERDFELSSINFKSLCGKLEKS